MNPETASNSEKDNSILEINELLKNSPCLTEGNEQIVEIQEFNPQIHKGVLITGESQHSIHQLILTTQYEGESKKQEVFAKLIKDPTRAEIERAAYLRCQENGIRSLNFLASIQTESGILNITETYNHLLPFSKIRIQDIKVYQDLLLKGLFALDAIHSIGIQHRDCLGRNLATNYLNPFIVFTFDFETSVLYDPKLGVPSVQKEQDRKLFLQDMFFHFLKQNEHNKDSIQIAETITENIDKEQN